MFTPFVKQGPIWQRKPTDTELRQILEEQSRLPFSYEPPNITRGGQALPGYRSTGATVELGAGRAAFDAGVAALQSWRVHEQARVQITSDQPVVVEGANVVMLYRLAVVYFTVACRVVYVIDTDNRWGFAYGTLPHHMERGEELFMLEIDHDEQVRFSVSAIWRPGHPLVKIGMPVTRVVQRAATQRYLKAMEDLVSKDRNAS